LIMVGTARHVTPDHDLIFSLLTLLNLILVIKSVSPYLVYTLMMDGYNEVMVRCYMPGCAHHDQCVDQIR
jgi:hypothetical protein